MKKDFIRDFTKSGNAERLFKTLKAGEIDLVEKFISDHENLSKDDFAIEANRWFLDNEQKPKNLSAMVELLISFNLKGRG